MGGGQGRRHLVPMGTKGGRREAVLVAPSKRENAEVILLHPLDFRENVREGHRSPNWGTQRQGRVCLLVFGQSI